MKKNILVIATALFSSIIGLSSSSMAYNVFVEDKSNQVITCDSPLLINAPSGACLSYPAGTLLITITLDKSEQQNLLDNIHVVISDIDGRLYQYQTYGSGELWQEVPLGIIENQLRFTSSFQKMPFEEQSREIIRQIDLSKFALNKGARLFVGLRENTVAGFVEGSIQEVYEVTQEMVDSVDESMQSVFEK